MKKKLWIEVLRVVCVIGVLADHVPIGAIHLFDNVSSDFDRFICNGIVHISHFAVPVFVMITGYLLLQPSKDIDFEKAIRKYAWRMIVVILIWGTIFAWMELFYSEKKFVFYQIPLALFNMFEGKTWNHMWYLYMLVGLYMVIPVLKMAVNSLSKRSVDIFIVLGIIFTSVMPCLERLFGITIGIQFPITSVYVFYLLLGYRIGLITSDVTKISRLFVKIIILVLVVSLFGFAYYENVWGYTRMVALSSYNSPYIVFLCSLIFYAFISTTKDFSRFMALGGTMVANYSFGIYVFHMIWINLIYKVIGFNPIAHGYWTMIPILLIVLGLSLITSIIYRKIPVIGKYI